MEVINSFWISNSFRFSMLGKLWSKSECEMICWMSSFGINVPTVELAFLGDWLHCHKLTSYIYKARGHPMSKSYLKRSTYSSLFIDDNLHDTAHLFTGTSCDIAKKNLGLSSSNRLLKIRLKKENWKNCHFFLSQFLKSQLY